MRPDRVILNVFGYRSIQSGQFICNSGTLIQILARFYRPDTVKTGHCHLKRVELRVKGGKGGLCPFSRAVAAPSPAFSSRKVSQFSNFNLGTCMRRPDRCWGAPCWRVDVRLGSPIRVRARVLRMVGLLVPRNARPTLLLSRSRVFVPPAPSVSATFVPRRY